MPLPAAPAGAFVRPVRTRPSAVAAVFGTIIRNNVLKYDAGPLTGPWRSG